MTRRSILVTRTQRRLGYKSANLQLNPVARTQCIYKMCVSLAFSITSYHDCFLSACFIQPKVIAVLDWELSTLGDPLTDVAYVCMLYHYPDDMPIHLINPSREYLVLALFIS